MKNYIVRRNDNSANWYDDAVRDFFRPFYFDEHDSVMKTDIKETEKDYVMDIEMAGFDKNDISVKLENGYVTVSAGKHEKEENDRNYLRRERSMNCSRSYYIGEVTEENVKAKYENGVLTLTFPKKSACEEKHVISIE